MQIKAILRVLGVLLMVFSLSMLPPILITEWYQDDTSLPFLLAFLLTLITGFFLWIPFRGIREELRTRNGFLIVVLFWVVLCLYGALPFMISEAPHETFTDALFETVSGLTATGATVTKGVDYLPHAIRYYRQQLQFLGGMGIIVLAVAILPMLGVGGMQLYRAEIPGPVKDAKLTPRIAQTAKALWYIYVGLTVFCMLAYWGAGMSLFNAIGESFATVSTGGFTMHDSSFAFYKNPTIEIIGIVFMILGATNFALHFLTLQRMTLRHYWEDLELRAFLFIMIAALAITLPVLLSQNFYPDVGTTLIKGTFNVVSLATTTGFVAGPFDSWPLMLPVIVMMVAAVGGCGGSTSGGAKTLRLVLLYKQAKREIVRLIHPKALTPLKFGEQLLPDRVLQAMWGFIAVYLGVLVFVLLGLMVTGLDFTTSFGASVATLANAGQGIGSATSNFIELSIAAKWILMFSMLAGRLEIFTVLVLFTPTFWRD